MNDNINCNDRVNRHVQRLLELAETDQQVGALMPIQAVREAACKPGLPYAHVIETFLNGYAQRPALGERTYEVLTCETTGKTIRSYLKAFNTIHYQELHRRVKALSMAWRTHPHCRVQRDDFVCVVGFASVDFAIIDIACAYSMAVLVPLSSKAVDTDLREIFATIQPTILASNIKDVSSCVEYALQQKSIKALIVFDYDSRVDEDVEIVNNAVEQFNNANSNTKVISIYELITHGMQFKFYFLTAETGDDEKLAMIIHTSGSTGKPKGACISAKALMNTWQRRAEALPKIAVIMAPFNHNMGRNELYETLSSGGTAYFTLKQDLTTVFEDIRLARPTSLVFFPRILEIIFQHFQIEVTKRQNLCKNNADRIEAAVKSEMKVTFLGDRLLSCAVASAPISSKIKTFIAECFDIDLINGYSTTETASGGLALEGKINMDIVLDYKLRDVPSLGYFSTDKPFPRGEFCVKTRFGITQYYNNPEATAQLFDEHGFCLTGDIVEEHCPGHISIIDRKVSVIKLSNGEFVALGKLGKFFEENSKLISQIFLYGRSQKSFILAIVVPDMNVAQLMLRGKITEKRLQRLIRAELDEVGQTYNLKYFEIPRNFFVENTPFTQARGLLSSVNKHLIPAFIKKYGHILDNMYEEYATIQPSSLETFKSEGHALSARDKLGQLLKMHLGAELSTSAWRKTFQELGGDSLAAVLFSLHIEEVFATCLEGEIILNPMNTINDLLRIVESKQRSDIRTISFSSIHGNSAKILRNCDLQLSRFIDQEILNISSKLPRSTGQPRTVLLTGANGFLGHMLCFQWLEKLARNGGKLICIIRARDSTGAKERLDAQFTGVDTKMESQYVHLSKQHLEVLAGDISEPMLGLSKETFRRLEKEVDEICHAGALVNHRLGYKHLFGSNVKGTAEVIRLAISQKIKTICYISTIGVNDFLDRSHGYDEESPLSLNVELTSKFASGYIHTKWASEHLLRQAHIQSGAPLNIFRCDFALPATPCGGLVNPNDMLTRLINSIILTGISPLSFYNYNKQSTQQLYFGGIPVDILSKMIVNSSILNDSSATVYNAYNFTNTTISFDTLVKLLENEGCQIKRISSNKEWLSIIKSKLQPLSPDQKQKTIVNMLDAFSEPFPTGQTLPACTNFKALARLQDIHDDVPILSEGYIKKYLRLIKSIN